jgi:hypothetical protein
LECHDGDLLGAELEEEVLVRLRSALEGHRVKDTVVITCWRDEGYKNTRNINLYCSFGLSKKERK